MGHGGGDLVKIAPAAADLSAERFEYHLDFPGNALDPGCDYERWARRLAEATSPTVYAHVATERGRPGKLALQYWLYYAFNDWNNTHEGDWEMIQLVFDAASAAEALERRPVEVGYSQHEGAERAAWDDDKLELVGGTHPVVHPAAGSHANFFDEALHLGRSASEGVGCDDTSGPHVDVRPRVRTIPSDPAQAREQFPWIAFEGRWGELQRSIFNGPTGPNLKSQWTEPIEWSEGWRSRSLAVPGAGALGTGATDFFCGAVAAGSNALRRAAEDPLPLFLVLVGLAVLLAFLLTRTTWRPAAPLRLARRRAWGQVLSASWRMYTGRIWLFLGLGLVALPDLRDRDVAAGGPAARLELSRHSDRRRGRGHRRVRGCRGRHRALAGRPRARPGGHGTRPRGDRPGQADLGRCRLTGWRSSPCARCSAPCSSLRSSSRCSPPPSSSCRSRSGSQSGGR